MTKKHPHIMLSCILSLLAYLCALALFLNWTGLDRTEGKVPGMQIPLPYSGMRFGDRTGGQVTEQGKEDSVWTEYVEGASTHHPGKGHIWVGSWGELRVR